MEVELPVAPWGVTHIARVPTHWDPIRVARRGFEGEHDAGEPIDTGMGTRDQREIAQATSVPDRDLREVHVRLAPRKRGPRPYVVRIVCVRVEAEPDGVGDRAAPVGAQRVRLVRLAGRAARVEAR